LCLNRAAKIKLNWLLKGEHLFPIPEGNNKEMTVDIIKEIYDAVMDGKVEEAAGRVQQALNAKAAANDILNKGLIAAMDVVGEKFGEGELFIPQVLWSAKAMQAGMDLLKPHFSAADRTQKGAIVIGTAKGDIHDIGKNLVAIMLEGSGFKVADLGVDVTPERFVEKAVEVKADVIAMSALLTTTMPSMGEVVSLVKAKKLPVKVVVGGAPVDQAFCDEIGADAYGMDAADGLRKIKGMLAR
jgi:5-methyltetrahydrofolate--homocysteine methyltransferase